ETDETGNLRRDAEPVLDLCAIFATTENNAADAATAVRSRSGDNRLIVLAAIKALDLPYIGFDTGLVQLAHGLDHQTRPDLEIVGLLVPPELVELRLLGWHQKLEHETAAAAGGEDLRQLLQPCRLPPVEGAVSRRIVAHQNLAECRVEAFDVVLEVLAILEV